MGKVWLKATKPAPGYTIKGSSPDPPARALPLRLVVKFWVGESGNSPHLPHTHHKGTENGDGTQARRDLLAQGNSVYCHLSIRARVSRLQPEGQVHLPGFYCSANLFDRAHAIYVFSHSTSRREPLCDHRHGLPRPKSFLPGP